jgi:phage shock protein C
MTTMPEPDKLYRSRSEKMIAGVLGGMSEHWNVDPSVIRIVYVVMTLFTGVIPGMFLYAVMTVIIPAEPKPAGDQKKSR